MNVILCLSFLDAVSHPPVNLSQPILVRCRRLSFVPPSLEPVHIYLLWYQVNTAATAITIKYKPRCPRTFFFSTCVTGNGNEWLLMSVCFAVSVGAALVLSVFFSRHCEGFPIHMVWEGEQKKEVAVQETFSCALG